MGGGSYDRDYYSSSSGWDSYSSSSYSAVADKAMGATTLSSDMSPKDRVLKVSAKHPIIIMLDVTGSNTSFAKIVYDKMPMFYGQIEEKGYLKDFEISVCAVGDAYCDDYPLQIADVAKGTEIDDWLGKLVLEGCGGGQRCETYELAAYYLLHNMQYDDGVDPIIFFIGDEAPYKEVKSHLIQSYVDSHYSGESADSKSVFQDLLKKCPHTYLILNPYNGYCKDTDIDDVWKEMFDGAPANIIYMQEGNEKAVVDIMLGVLALINNGDLASYKVDMLGRGQTAARIESVDKTLLNLSNSLVPVTTVSGLQKSTGSTRGKGNSKSSRL